MKNGPLRVIKWKERDIKDLVINQQALYLVHTVHATLDVPRHRFLIDQP